MKPREEVEHKEILYKVIKNSTLWDACVLEAYEGDVFDLIENILFAGFSRHPQQCKKELKELDEKAIKNSLGYPTNRILSDNEISLIRYICDNFGSPVSKEVSEDDIFNILHNTKIRLQKDGCSGDLDFMSQGSATIISKAICKRLNGNEKI